MQVFFNLSDRPQSLADSADGQARGLRGENLLFLSEAGRYAGGGGEDGVVNGAFELLPFECAVFLALPTGRGSSNTDST